MVSSRTIRDTTLIDAADKLRPSPFTGKVYRAVRDGRDPTIGASSGGRWDDGTFDVLYTSTASEGAMAEISFHLLRGQPIAPSKVQYRMFELDVTAQAIVSFTSVKSLEPLGLDVSIFGKLSYADRVGEYPRTQEISEAIHFLGHQGVIVPNARWDCLNLVLFTDRCGPSDIVIAQDMGIIQIGKGF